LPRRHSPSLREPQDGPSFLGHHTLPCTKREPEDPPCYVTSTWPLPFQNSNGRAGVQSILAFLWFLLYLLTERQRQWKGGQYMVHPHPSSFSLHLLLTPIPEQQRQHNKPTAESGIQGTHAVLFILILSTDPIHSKRSTTATRRAHIPLVVPRGG